MIDPQELKKIYVLVVLQENPRGVSCRRNGLANSGSN